MADFEHAACKFFLFFSSFRPLCLFISASQLLALLRPREVRDGNDEEAVKEKQHESAKRPQMVKRLCEVRTKLGLDPHAACRLLCDGMNHGSEATYLFDVSAIPARALYHARKAAKIPKPPPHLMSSGSGAPFTR